VISSHKTVSLVLLAVISVALLAGCNDTLRQFIVPLPKPGGDSQPAGNAVVLSTNPVGNGSTMHINVSGDSNVGVLPTGTNPVFLGKGGNNAFVINGDGTVTTYPAVPPSPAFLQTATLPGPPLPDQAITSVAGGTSNSGNFFVANRDSDNTSVIAGGLAAVTSTIALPAGSHPVAVAGNRSNSKIYVVNQGAGDVTVVSTTDNTVVKTIPVGAQPIWAVMSADGVDVFVVNQGAGTVSVIDTTVDVVIATITVGSSAAPSPNFAFYEPNRQRVYVSNTGENTVSVIKADGINLGVTPQILPTLLKNIAVSGTPVSVAALNDGTRAYAALGNCPAGTNHTNLLANLASCNGNLVSVIDATGLRESGTITVGAGAVSVDVAADASRVYAVAAHAGTVADIRVATNAVLTFSAPQQNLSCTSPAVCPANVTQTPFMVRTFP
jgi:YVTN family beta-propeller protein